MSITPDSISRSKRFRWHWIYGLLLLLALPLPAIEIYDHVPRRTWLYRQLKTEYFVDVTAQLEVDGAPLTLSRTIRCIHQPKPWSLEPSAPEEMSVFDALGGVSASGRTFVMNVTRACARLMGTHYLDRQIHPLPTLHIRPGDAERPPVYEPVGTGRLPDYVYSYSDAVLKDGRYGVKLIEITLADSSKTFQMFDRGAYDWIGGGGWYTSEGGTKYMSHYVVEVPQELWAQALVTNRKIAACVQSCLLNMLLPEYEPMEALLATAGNIDRTAYPLNYNNGSFRMMLDKPGLGVFIQLPKGYEVYNHGLSYSYYDLDGKVQEVTVNDRLYVDATGRAFQLNYATSVYVRR